MTQKLKNIIQLLISFDELSEKEQDAIANQIAQAIGSSKKGESTESIEKPLNKRIPGLEEGRPYYIANDFDDPLPDSFWLGES